MRDREVQVNIQYVSSKVVMQFKHKQIQTEIKEYLMNSTQTEDL